MVQPLEVQSKYRLKTAFDTGTMFVCVGYYRGSPVVINTDNEEIGIARSEDFEPVPTLVSEWAVINQGNRIIVSFTTKKEAEAFVYTWKDAKNYI